MRLLAWNINQGSGSRFVGIMDAIARHDADVLILSEFHGGGRLADMDLGALRLTGVYNPSPAKPGR